MTHRRLSPEQIRQVLAEADCLYREAEVERELDRLAREITARHADSNPIMLCVMTGGLIPAGHLLTRLSFPLEVDYIHATRYAGGTRGGSLHWQTEPDIDLQDREILIIDDILDEGITLAAIVDYCRQQGASSVFSMVLVEKRHDRKNGIRADYVGLEIGDRYVFGYGMDYHGYLRNAAGIYAVKGM
ncbi:MAG TPA: hypoxanthine-guanine phosphoribosyltransferase [Chromatiales bacterium]|nr:hypoxanthine-guanine phosphoribosyltransferase [Chromatiales bacterium]